MLRNLFRQSFWAVFVPLLVAAGLFWMDELRGYRSEVSIFAFPKTDIAIGAADNLAALAEEIPFALSVYAEPGLGLTDPLVGKTPAERRVIWSDMARIQVVSESDVIHISAFGETQAAALSLAKGITAEIVRTASRYYNQKTDLDIRIIAEPVAIPSLTAWPRFVTLTLGTAFFFTVLFFIVYSLIERMFPKRTSSTRSGGEYVITSDTFKPRVPTYWNHEESVSPITPESAADRLEEPVSWPSQEQFSEADEQDEQIESSILETITPTAPVEESAPLETAADVRDEDDIYAWGEEEIDETANAAPPVTPMQNRESVGYVSHAAAPDNLPILEGPITPLQGAQSRLMKADIDAAVAEREANLSLESEEASKPQTHEPTAEEYRRRLNDLLSGRM